MFKLVALFLALGYLCFAQQCFDEECCLFLQDPNPFTGHAYLEFAEECLDGGLNCVDEIGCRLCWNPFEGDFNLGDRPVCERFGEPQTGACLDQECCLERQIPNPNTGHGYLEFAEECLDGGLHCVDETGCRLCWNPFEGDFNLGNRPVCERFGDAQTGNGTCEDEECCIERQNPNPNTGHGYLEFAEECLDGGLHCVDETGCRLCWNPEQGDFNLGNRPVCERFGEPQTGNGTCEDQECCLERQNPNPDTGHGYLEFAEECLDGGLHCVDETGCRLCWNPFEGDFNLGDRPVCERFGDAQTGDVCEDEECCVERQNPNPDTGHGYLEFAEECLDGGLHCVDETGCRLCWNPEQGDFNLGNRPVCQRFLL